MSKNKGSRNSRSKNNECTKCYLQLLRSCHALLPNPPPSHLPPPPPPHHCPLIPRPCYCRQLSCQSALISWQNANRQKRRMRKAAKQLNWEELQQLATEAAVAAAAEAAAAAGAPGAAAAPAGARAGVGAAADS